MKNIVLLTYDLSIEYCLDILHGVSSFFADQNDIHLIVAQVKSKNDTHGTFLFHYASSIETVCASDIDGYIILSTTFGNYLDEIVSQIRRRTEKPIVSIGMDLNYKNCYSTLCDSKEIFKELVSHLKENHDCKKVGFFSANETNSTEATERFNSYKQAIKDCGLEYNENYILHGNFTRYRAKQVIAEKFKSKEEIPFDSIICANDLTASGCQEAFSALGLSIPEDLKIIGFDDSNIASLSEPSLSTVNQQIKEQGYLAAKQIYHIVNNHEIIDSAANVQLAPVYRQSCGCIEKSNKDYVYKDKYGKSIIQSTDYREFLKSYYEKMNDHRNIYGIFDFLHSNDSLENLSGNVNDILKYTSFLGMSISLFDNPITWQAGLDFKLPEKMKFVTVNDKTKNLQVTLPDYSYNPYERLMPAEFDEIPGFFILHPIYNCFTNYGYFLSHYNDQKMEIYSIHLKIINQAIAQAAEISKTNELNRRLEMEKQDLVRTNSDLAKQSKTDELTKILNRRGFMEYGQQQINLSVSINTNGAVFFADLDGLKIINDNFGHEMGDLAITLAAKALKSSFRKTDIVGRLSGDEFAIVATDMSLELLERTRSKLDMNCKTLQEQNNLPFPLSLSLGGVQYTENSYFLKELLIKADESLYDEKKRHHKFLKQQMENLHS